MDVVAKTRFISSETGVSVSSKQALICVINWGDLGGCRIRDYMALWRLIAHYMGCPTR